MALRNILGITVGLAAALGGAALAARKLFGASDDAAIQFTGDGASASGASTAPVAPREGLDPTLLEILACPDDKEPVIYQKEGDAERLTCTVCGKRYPVRDGIPIMLIDEATTGPVPTAEEVEAAKKLVPEGKPALVGNGATASGSGAAAVSPSGSASPSAAAPGPAGASVSSSASAPATQPVPPAQN